jgi:Putative DNA-binding domain
MQEVVVHPGSIDDALSSERARAEVPPGRLGDVVLPSRTLRPAERVEIYQRMYPLRMEEALEIDYPTLKAFLGEDGFRTFVRRYVASFPSRSYTLNRLGDHVPEFVRADRGLRHRAFCHDLVRLELAMTQVFDEAETPALSAAAVAAVPADAWPGLRLRPIAAFRLLELRYPVNAYLQAVRDGTRRPARPRREDGWLAVFRRSYRVRRLELSRPAHRLLSDLVSGVPLGEAVVAAARRRGTAAAGQTQLYRWFREWMKSGLFMGLEGLEPSTNRL